MHGHKKFSKFLYVTIDRLNYTFDWNGILCAYAECTDCPDSILKDILNYQKKIFIIYWKNRLSRTYLIGIKQEPLFPWIKITHFFNFGIFFLFQDVINQFILQKFIGKLKLTVASLIILYFWFLAQFFNLNPIKDYISFNWDIKNKVNLSPNKKNYTKPVFGKFYVAFLRVK